jgi:hypothetical protein
LAAHEAHAHPGPHPPAIGPDVIIDPDASL